MRKMENSPPHSKTAPPQTSEFAKLDKISVSILVMTFLFWAEKTFEFQNSAEKSL